MVSENRRFLTSVCGLVAMFSAFIGVLLVGGKYFTGSMGLVASGVTYDFGAYGLRGEDCVVAAAHVVNVFEPRSHLTNAIHAQLLERQLAAARVNRRLMSRELVARGYSSWVVAADEPPFNYTFGVARRLAKSVAEKFKADCVCYAFLGIAENIVFVNASDEVLFEPRIVVDGKNAQALDFSEPYPLMKLLKSAYVKNKAHEQHISVVSQRPWWDLLSSETFKLMNRGLVEYITESGDALRRREFTQGYACIKYCVSFFE
jgi:hypothetical protein